MAGEGTIRFSLARAGHVEIDLYNVMGQRVRGLVDGWYDVGEHAEAWRSSGSSESLAPGVYFVRLESGGATQSQKILLSR
jgi:hypothetical protein